MDPIALFIEFAYFCRGLEGLNILLLQHHFVPNYTDALVLVCIVNKDWIWLLVEFISQHWYPSVLVYILGYQVKVQRVKLENYLSWQIDHVRGTKVHNIKCEVMTDLRIWIEVVNWNSDLDFDWIQLKEMIKG